MLRLCDVVRAKFFMGPKQLKQLLAEGGPKPLPPQIAANALADTQRWRTDRAATGGIVPRPGVPAAAGTVEAMQAGLFGPSGERLPPAGVSGLLMGSANAPMSVSSRAIAPMGGSDDQEEGDSCDDCTCSGCEAATAATAEVVKKPAACCDVSAADAPGTKSAKNAKAKNKAKKDRRGRGGRNSNAAVVA